jgi:hypothetical protein
MILRIAKINTFSTPYVHVYAWLHVKDFPDKKLIAQPAADIVAPNVFLNAAALLFNGKGVEFHKSKQFEVLC